MTDIDAKQQVSLILVELSAEPPGPKLRPAPGMEEVALLPQDVLTKTSDYVAQRSEEAMDRAMDTIRSMADRVMTALDTVAVPPDKVEVTFGLKLTAEGNVYVTKASAETTLEVKLGWARGGKAGSEGNGHG